MEAPQVRHTSVASKGGLHIAVVHGPSQVYFVVAGWSRTIMVRRLCCRLDAQVDVQLWEADAVRFRELLSRERFEDAIDLYFSRVGSRWDLERLSTHTVEL